MSKPKQIYYVVLEAPHKKIKTLENQKIFKGFFFMSILRFVDIIFRQFLRIEETKHKYGLLVCLVNCWPEKGLTTKQKFT
jgi:hypothetical protein